VAERMGAAAAPAGGRQLRWLRLMPPLLLGAAVLASVLAWPHVPDPVTTRFNLQGEPIGQSGRALALLMLPGTMIWIGFLTWAVTHSTLQTREARDLPAWTTSAAVSGMLAFLLALHLALLGMMMGWGISIALVMNLLVGVLMIALGRVMPRVPPNPLFGVRTPRTLECPDTWRHANQVGGRWMVYAGVITILGGPLPEPWPMAVMMGALALMAAMSLKAVRDVTGDSR
jgi:uncharacterized membrane protein